MRMHWWALSLSVWLAIGCGKSGPEEVAQEDTYGDEDDREVDDGMDIEGILGTLSKDAITRGLEPRMQRFAGCFGRRWNVIEVLSGRVDLSFRVARDGTVRSVHLRASTVGDRPTEQCVLEVARTARFSKPQGGEAEFSWPLEFDAPDDVRLPVDWGAEHIEPLLQSHAGDILSECGSVGGGFQVTVYVAPGGHVLTAGAAVDDPSADPSLDCISERIAGWTMPDPGSYPAKVTFVLR